MNVLKALLIKSLVKHGTLEDIEDFSFVPRKNIVFDENNA
jgi:hypothetical protein